MIKIKNKKNCSGCHACENICPKNCITMTSDNEGFLYPVADKDKCVNCGLCDKVCPILNKRISQNTPEAYACINKNDAVREVSSSGGIFSLLAENVIKADGVVFGAVYNDDFLVSHKSAITMDEVTAMYGSKYVQSKIGNTYFEAKRYLEDGKQVLFSGTPCQIGGLKSYLNKDYPNLICVDIICHGVPSPKVWETYIKWQQNRYNSKINSVSMRSKKQGWNTFSMNILFDNDKEYIKDLRSDSYMQVFLKDVALRPSCYRCNFKGISRNSDITLADYWGVEKQLKNFSDDKGTSLVWINTEKGKRLFESIISKIYAEKVGAEKSIQSNPNAVRSARCRVKRKQLFKKLHKESFDVLADKYTKEAEIKKKARVIYHKLKSFPKKLKQ